MAREGAVEYAREYLNCSDCESSKDVETRSGMNCGRLPPEKRRPQMPPFPEASVCPGYLISLPLVAEAARALAWRRDGQLSLLYDETPTPLLRDAVDVLDVAAKEQEREELRKASEASRGRP